MERPIRVLTVRPSLDGHWRGLAVVTAALRDAGVEVVYGGTALNAEEIVNAALQEDVDAIGLSMYGGFGIAYGVLERVRGLPEAPAVMVGGTVPPAEVAKLKNAGAAGVFVAGSSLNEIVQFFRDYCGARRQATGLEGRGRHLAGARRDPGHP